MLVEGSYTPLTCCNKSAEANSGKERYASLHDASCTDLHLQVNDSLNQGLAKLEQGISRMAVQIEPGDIIPYVSYKGKETILKVGSECPDDDPCV